MLENTNAAEPSSNEWKLVKLGDMTQIVGGTTPSTSQPSYWDGEITWITPADLGKKSGVTIGNSERKISQKGLDSCALQILPAQSVIISCRAPIGHLAIVTVDFCTNQGCKALLASKKVVPGFLYYSLLQSVPKIKALGAGATFAEISKSELEKFEILLPSIETQTRIATILTNLDQLITTTEALLAKQQRLHTGLLHDLLTRGLDQHGQLRSEETHEFKDSPLGRIPVEWEAEVLSKHVDVYGGKRLPAGHAYAEGATQFRYLRVMDFYKKSVVASQLESLEEPTYEALIRYKIDPGDLYISIAGSIGFVGVVQIPENECKLILTENAARLKLSSKVDAYFLALAMNAKQIQHQIGEAIGTGGGVPKLAIFRIKMLLMPVPQLEEQKKITETITQLVKQQQISAKRLAKFRRLKTGLMQDLLTGRIPVGDLDSLLPEA